MHIVNRTDLFSKSEVERAIATVRDALRAALPAASFGEREAAVLAVTDEAVRRLLQEELQAIADGLGDELLIDGVPYKAHEPGGGCYHALCGPLSVGRHTYREVGVRNGPTVVPLELIAGIVEGATPALAYNVAQGYGQHDMRVHEEQLLTAHRHPPSRTTLERIATRIGGAAVEAAPRIEAVLRRSEKLPEGTVAVALGLDRTAVAMVEDRPADAPPKPEIKRRKARVRSAPPPIDITWRMAYVGSVTYVDVNGEALGVVRYAAPACDDPRPLVESMTADVKRALRQDDGLNVGIVQDGGREMWDRTREGLQVLRDGGVLQRWHEGIDKFHLLERLGSALQLVEPDAAERKRLLDEWREGLDVSNSAIDKIEDYLILRYDALDVANDCRTPLWEHLRYISNHKHQMRYAALRKAGLPVGSGVTESTAKTVVGHRAKRSGQRWREAGLRGAITLRALHQSDRLPRFWARLSANYTATVEAA
jgi:hypothetical protein